MSPGGNTQDYEEERCGDRHVLFVIRISTSVGIRSLPCPAAKLCPIVGLPDFLRQTPQVPHDVLVLFHGLPLYKNFSLLWIDVHVCLPPLGSNHSRNLE